MPTAIESPSVVIRDIESVEEMRATEDLQIEAWGEDDRGIVPLNQFAAARHVGGSLVGAFDNEKLVGFVYGFWGHVLGRIVHHSHMLAVSSAYRNHNLAYRLKLAQRTKVLADKLTDRITWTFDPLQSINAHFNFAKLGIVSDVYKINIYGDAGASFLHQNGTDRLFVTWLIKSQRVEERVAGNSASVEKNDDAFQGSVRLLTNSNSGMPEPLADLTELTSADSVLIEVPTDMISIESSDFELARKWREESRRAFSEAISAGFVVTEYFRKNEQAGSYLLQRKRIDDFF
ncbi:MAG: GNAT family N-acetyltransferase [bacterium]|nr:GNAT family N-acetyltransferase [bacterium]